MRVYYEELWERLPADLVASDFGLRTAFVRARVRPGDRALDLGCGDGQFIDALVQAGADVTAADVAQAALERARLRHPAADFARVPFDGELPFADGSFEVVWAGEVIEHVADTARWLSEVRRVLVPRGRLLLTTPNHGRLRLALTGIEPFSEPLGDHLHLYTRRSLAGVLSEFGFGPVHVRPAVGPPGLRRLLLAEAQR